MFMSFAVTCVIAHVYRQRLKRNMTIIEIWRLITLIETDTDLPTTSNPAQYYPQYRLTRKSTGSNPSIAVYPPRAALDQDRPTHRTLMKVLRR